MYPGTFMRHGLILANIRYRNHPGTGTTRLRYIGTPRLYCTLNRENQKVSGQVEQAV